jgi:hypothetical protein
VRCYGYYNNVSREKPEEKTEISEINAPPLYKDLKKRGPTSFEKFMKQTAIRRHLFSSVRKPRRS